MAECLLEDERIAHKTPDVVFVRPRQARLLHRGMAKIVVTALREIDTIITRLAYTDSKVEFEKTRDNVFSDYANLSYIIANSFAITSDRSVRPAAIKQAFKTVEEVFQTEGTRCLGADAASEAFFCLDTLRRAYRLVDAIRIGGDLPAASQEFDGKLAQKFNFAALWAQLHLDCLRVVITKRTVPKRQVVDDILQGSRLSVMAYSYARQGVELRTKREPYLLEVGPDQEDQELLDESYSDYVDSESNIDAEM